jgi:hypothetical protein
MTDYLYSLSTSFERKYVKGKISIHLCSEKVIIPEINAITKPNTHVTEI